MLTQTVPACSDRAVRTAAERSRASPCRQAVRHAVGLRDHRVDVAPRDDGEAGPKSLLLGDPHVVPDAVEERGGEEEPRARDGSGCAAARPRRPAAPLPFSPSRWPATTRSSCSREMSAPTWVSLFVGSPNRKGRSMFRGEFFEERVVNVPVKGREPAKQTSPWHWRESPETAPSTARSMSACGEDDLGALPPELHRRGDDVLRGVLEDGLPVAVSPVNATFRDHRGGGRAAPGVGAVPGDDVQDARGKEVGELPRELHSAVRGVCSAGFRSVFPPRAPAPASTPRAGAGSSTGRSPRPARAAPAG